MEQYTSLNIAQLTTDLGIAQKLTTTLLKSLGARIEAPKGTEFDKVIAAWQNDGKTVGGNSDVASGKLKIASLKLPLDFPREVNRGKAKAKR